MHNIKRVSILVDVQNVYYTTRQAHQRSFDYRLFWRAATDGRQVVSAYAYAIDKGDRQQAQFQQILREIGFEVKLKPFIQRADGSAKGDWDVGITIDALDCAKDSDVIVLVSGDGDFAILVDKLRDQLGKTVEVWGVPELTAKSLMDAASQIIAIDETKLLAAKSFNQ